MSESGYVLRVRPRNGEMCELLAPSVGIFALTVAEGELVSAGQSIGTVDVLGVLRELKVPDGIAGQVTARVGGARSRVPVQYGDAVLTISMALGPGVSAASSTGAAASESGLAFFAPMSGRFYSRPSPSEPPFISVGDTVHSGQTVGILEVMKTFNRVVYEGETLPNQAIVERIVPVDGQDVVRGEMILALEPVAET